MRTRFFQGTIGAALLGVCLWIGRGDVRPSAQASEPPPPAPAQASPEVRSDLPILFDYRQVVAAQDVSGLSPGRHSIELDVYAPSQTGWTPEGEQRVREGIRVLHVESRTPAATGFSFGRPERGGARHLRVDMDLDEAGSWVVILGDGLVAAHANPELLAHYDVRDPQALRPAGDYEYLHPNLMLRTVGRCNHVHKVITRVDEGRTLRTIELHFSEPLPDGAVRGAIRMGMRDSEGQTRPRVPTESARAQGKVVELRVPAAKGVRGELEIPLARIPGLAGGFRDTLSCAEADGSIGVGYTFGEQASGEHVVSPLAEAMWRALGEEKQR